MDRRAFLSSAVMGLAGIGISACAKASTPVVPGSFASGNTGPRPELLAKAYKAFSQHHKQIKQRDVIAIADFSSASHLPRFHLLDMLNGRTTAFLVAHGKGSDPEHSGWVQYFSNLPGSEATSSGSYVVGDTYIGQHGYSRRLAGLDKDNDQAEARAIVIHPAWYVSEEIAAQQGKVGRSQGCFAFSQNDIGQIISRLGTGTLLYADKV